MGRKLGDREMMRRVEEARLRFWNLRFQTDRQTDKKKDRQRILLIYSYSYASPKFRHNRTAHLVEFSCSISALLNIFPISAKPNKSLPKTDRAG